MAIQWFPGHMHKARKKIAEEMPNIDLVIEVLDARLPYSSMNPLVDGLRRDKPCIKVLNKADLADPGASQQWVNYFEKQHNTRALPMVAEDRAQVKKLVQLIQHMSSQFGERKINVRVMIMGIPNVGKSTLINALAGRYVAKTGNEPAVTKANQMIDLKNGIILSDTPGILWPKFENEESGYRLAASGAVRDTAMEYIDVAMHTLGYLLKYYGAELAERFKFKELPASPEEALNTIGSKRGCLKPGGIVDMHKAAELCLHELRAGKIGRISLEFPELVAEELAAIEAEKAALAEALAAEQAAEAKKNAPYRPES